MTDVKTESAVPGMRMPRWIASAMLALALGACGDLSLEELDATGEAPLASTLRALLDGEGGELVGPAGTPFAGVRLTIPRGALKAPTMVSLREAEPTSKLPETAVQVGRSFALEPTGLTLSTPASLTLPFDQKVVTDRQRQARDVRMWVFDGASWSQILQQASGDGSVTVKLDALFGGAAPGLPAGY
ncbi:MAG: hypothetical protein ABW252_22140 [Polyangiales bacterium]